MTTTYHPATADRWPDLENLFESASATRNCWCMWWRIAGNAWRDTTRSSRQDSFRQITEAGPPPGILAYRHGQVAAWVQVTPRLDVPRFNAPRAASRPEPGTDVDTTWILSCFFTASAHRGFGLMEGLARAACAFAVEQGATSVEAVPIDPKPDLQWSDGYVGIRPSLEHAGFQAVERRGKVRTLMRWKP